MKRDERRGLAAAGVTILIWGTTFISTKVLLGYFSPVQILLARFIIGYVALWLIYPHRMRFKGWAQEGLLAAAGVCGVTLYYLLENIALQYTSASHVGIIVSISPFFTALIAWACGARPPGKRFFVGFFLALCGIALLQGAETEQGTRFGGDLLALLAAGVWAIYALLCQRVAAIDAGALATTRRTFFYGLLGMLPACAMWGNPFVHSGFTPGNIFNLLYLGLGASALCFITWNIAVRALGPVRTSTAIYVVPVITTAACVFLLGEAVTVSTVAGIALTLIGLMLSQEKER